MIRYAVSGATLTVARTAPTGDPTAMVEVNIDPVALAAAKNEGTTALMKAVDALNAVIGAIKGRNVTAGGQL